MSAWTVSKAHIDALVNAGIQYGLMGTVDAAHVGAMLWDENHRSVNHLYREETPTPAYRPTLLPPGVLLDPVATLKVVACYDYQTCESSDYNTTIAYQWGVTLREALIATLPAALQRRVPYVGDATRYAFTETETYNAAPWGVDELGDVAVLVEVETEVAS